MWLVMLLHDRCCVVPTRLPHAKETWKLALARPCVLTNCACQLFQMPISAMLTADVGCLHAQRETKS